MQPGKRHPRVTVHMYRNVEQQQLQRRWLDQRVLNVPYGLKAQAFTGGVGGARHGPAGRPEAVAGWIGVGLDVTHGLTSVSNEGEQRIGYPIGSSVRLVYKVCTR